MLNPLVAIVGLAGAAYTARALYNRFYRLRVGDVAIVPAARLQPIPPGVPGFTASGEGKGSPLDVKVLVLITNVTGDTAGGQALAWQDFGSAGYLAVNGTKFPLSAAEPYLVGGRHVRDVTKGVTMLPSPVSVTTDNFLAEVATQPGLDFAVMLQNGSKESDKAMVTVESLGYDGSRSGQVLATIVPSALATPSWVPLPGSIVSATNRTAWPLPGHGATQVK